MFSIFFFDGTQLLNIKIHVYLIKQNLQVSQCDFCNIAHTQKFTSVNTLTSNKKHKYISGSGHIFYLQYLLNESTWVSCVSLKRSWSTVFRRPSFSFLLSIFSFSSSSFLLFSTLILSSSFSLWLFSIFRISLEPSLGYRTQSCMDLANQQHILHTHKQESVLKQRTSPPHPTPITTIRNIHVYLSTHMQSAESFIKLETSQI